MSMLDAAILAEKYNVLKEWADRASLELLHFAREEEEIPYLYQEYEELQKKYDL